MAISNPQQVIDMKLNKRERIGATQKNAKQAASTRQGGLPVWPEKPLVFTGSLKELAAKHRRRKGHDKIQGREFFCFLQFGEKRVELLKCSQGWGIRSTDDRITYFRDLWELEWYCARLTAWTRQAKITLPALSKEAQKDFDALKAKLENTSAHDVKSPIDLDYLDKLWDDIKRYIKGWDERMRYLPLDNGYYMIYTGTIVCLHHKQIDDLQILDAPGANMKVGRGDVRSFIIKVKGHKPKKIRKVNTKKAKAKMIAKYGYTL